MASTPWYQDPVSQAHGVAGEQGVDLATPFHTPLTALYGGTVQSASYGPWGGLLDIIANVPGYGTLNEYLLHLDQIAVTPGQQVQAGDVVGLSGGQLSGGAHPATAAYSSGPHVEAGFFTGSPFASSAIDPTALVQSGGDPAGQAADSLLSWNPISGFIGPGNNPFGAAGGAVAGGIKGAAGTVGGVASGLTGDVGAIGQGVQSGLNSLGQQIGAIPTSIGHGLANFLAVGVEDAGVFLKRQIVALAVAALVLLILFG